MKSIIISGICGKTGANVYESAKEAGLNVACGIDREYITEISTAPCINRLPT